MGINRNKVLNAARKQVRKGNWEKAISKYQELVDDDPSDARSQLKIADLYSKLDRTEEALDAYGAVAKHYAADDIYEKAVAVYKQALRLAPDKPTLHRDLGDAYHRLGRLKDAVRSYHKAQKIYKQAGDAAAQRELLERMIRLDPDDIGMRIQLAERYAKDNLQDQALELFEFAAEKLDDEGRIDEYVQVAERIIFLKDDALHLRRRVIDIYLRRGDNKHALKHLQVCFKLHPQNVGILELLVETFRRLERNDKAVLVMHELANLYGKQSRQDDVAQTYEEILELDPSDKRAKKELQKLDRLADSSVMTGRRDTGPLDAQRNHTPAEPQQIDALDGIEFLDDESEGEMEVVEVPEARQQSSPVDEPNTLQTLDDVELIAINDDFDEVDDSDISDEIEVIEAVEPTIERSGPQTSEEEIATELKETDVFIKYGLHDKAYETIVGVIARHPDSLQAREQMKKLQHARGNPEGAVDELLEMARITRTTPGRAQKFIAEALELTSDVARVNDAAQAYGLTAGDVDPDALDEISVIEFDDLSVADSANPVDDGQLGNEMSDELLELDMGDLEFVDEEPDEVDPAELEAGFQEIEQSVVEMSEIELDVDDLDGLELVEDTDAEMLEVSDDDLDLDFDESAFADADVVDMDVDLDGLGELSDEQMVALDDATGDAAGQDDFGFDISEEEADSMFDDLFGDFDGPSEAVNLGGDDPLGELAEVDFFLQQGLVSEAQETLDRVQEENPQHGGIQKRARQIEQARDGIEPNANPFGARSLSQKFHPGAEHESTGSLNLGDAAFNNTSIELGTAYRDMGLLSEAIAEFEQALDDPQAADAAQFHIALCELDQGNQAAATERLQTLTQQADADGIRKAAQQKLEELGA